MSGTVSKIAAERNQKTLLELAMKPGNDLCADCKTRNPRWASHNLGIFICVNCASIHRKIGTHVSKVKSLTMDVWTKEQVENIRQVGNIKSNQTYNPDEVRNPPPTNMIDAERDSELEKFIRDKYEFKRFINRTSRSAIVAAHLGPSRSAASVKSSTSSSSFSSNPSRSQTLPLSRPSIPPATSAPAAPTRAPTMPPGAPTGTAMTRSVSQPVSHQAQLQPPQAPVGSVWSDLATLQGQNQNSTLPLQYLSSPVSPPVPALTSHLAAGGSGLSATLATGVSSNTGLAFHSPNLVPNVATTPVQPSFVTSTSTINPFAQMAAQQQQAQQNRFLSTSPFDPSLSQQLFLTQVQPQVQQSTFSHPGTNPFFSVTPQSQGMLSPQPQAPFMSSTPSPVPFMGSPFQQQQQQPNQAPLQQQQPLFQQPAQQPSSASVVGNPFTSWLTQQPNGYAGAHVEQGSGQWGTM